LCCEAATIVSMMAEQADDQEIIPYIYMGGQDVVPRNATHVRVDESVKVIPFRAFFQLLTSSNSSVMMGWTQLKDLHSKNVLL
jgi:hypothetical protein